MIKKEIKESILNYCLINIDMEESDIRSSINLLSQVFSIGKDIVEFEKMEENFNDAYSSDIVKPNLKLFDFESFCKLMVYITDKKYYDNNVVSSEGKRLLSLKKCILKLDVLDSQILDDLTVKDENGRIIVYSRSDSNNPINKYRDNKDIDIISSISLRNEFAHESGKMTDFDYYWYYTCLITSFFKILNKYKNSVIRYFLSNNMYANNCISKYEKKIKEGYNYIPVKINPKLGNPIFNTVKDILVTDIHSVKGLRVIKIIGYAGVGKTSLLEELRYRDLKKYIASPSRNKISVIVSLINVSDGKASIEEVIADTLSVSVETVDMLVKEDKLNIYFDGVNELRISDIEEKALFLEKLEDFINNYKGSGYIIVTDRDSNDLSILNDYKIIPTIIIKEFSDEEVNNYIVKNVPADMRENISNIIDNYRDNNKIFYGQLKKPFMLNQFIILVLNGDVIPTSDVEVTVQYLKSLVNREITEKKNHIAKYIIKGLRYVLKNYECNDNFYIDYDDLNILLNKYKNEVLEDNNAYLSADLISLMEKLGIIKEALNTLGGIIFAEDSYYYALLGD
ncbi:MAG: hypothetical protein IKF91_04700 [Bacilli bacterium]|nr:hypothetical protein [Bacilli bacterium]